MNNNKATLENDKLSIKEGLILLSFLAIILIVPLLILQTFEKSWEELSWRNPAEIAMIEWTGAFLKIFLFLMLIEHFRNCRRLIFIFLANGFLGMGMLDFIYAVSNQGTETAIWLRAFSFAYRRNVFCNDCTTEKSQIGRPDRLHDQIYPTGVSAYRYRRLDAFLYRRNTAGTAY